jgi:hypothetical protein
LGPGALRKHCQQHRELIEGWDECGIQAATIAEFLELKTCS